MIKSPIKAPVRRPASDGDQSGQMKILVVDDEQLVRWFMDRALKKSGHEVISVSSADEASSYIDSRAVDIAIVDLRMPGVGGLEVIKRAGDLADRPGIIVCSGFITSEMEEDFQQKGIEVLKKPFKLDELNNALRRCVEGRLSSQS